MKTLPPEQSLHGSTPSLPSRSPATPSPNPLANAPAVSNPNGHSAAAAANASTQPPAYSASALPLGSNDPQHIEITHAVAQYRYHDPDPHDLDFEAGDYISVTAYCNSEWWQGKNIRTGKEGIFPRNYVRVENVPSASASKNTQYSGEKAYGGLAQSSSSHYGGQQPYQQQQPPNPYDGPVPPMAVAEQPADGHALGGKGTEMGKKFGKKLGNAAIFGAGATLGGNIVNSIF